METKARKRQISDVQDEHQENARQRTKSRSTLYRDRNYADANLKAVEGQDHDGIGPTQTDTVQQQLSQPKKQRSLLDRNVRDHVKHLWDKCSVLAEAIKNMPYSEGLKPLKSFASFDELWALGGDSLLVSLAEDNKNLIEKLNSTAPFLKDDGSCKSLNYNTQPVIGVIYGPTGCGKSQLLRNLISSHLLSPAPETVFFIAPQTDMIPPQEMTAWETQICEGNYTPGPEGTIVPLTGTLKPNFIKLSYDELLADHNYDVTNPLNVFAKAASKGPIAIIMDECMEELGKHKGIAKFFHAFPSKLHDKYPQCTGYAVLVVLHNMNPRKDQGGNISNLKIQSKLHIISPKMHPSQLTRFINIYTKGLPTAMTLLLKDIFSYHSTHSNYDWVIYNTCPEHESLQWLYLNPTEGLMPIYMNVQTHLYHVLEKIHKTISDRERWTRYYHSKRNKLY
ncbi:IVa2 [Tree shrew adenovirus 1]|uniref:Packaging protein 1 n=1 Tax=Tree shrew adenovirus serotype 1 TaxID=47680 RepID=A0A2U9AG77_ADET1|nr:IVa2 [Tree shrew adenovirus 1]